MTRTVFTFLILCDGIMTVLSNLTTIQDYKTGDCSVREIVRYDSIHLSISKPEHAALTKHCCSQWILIVGPPYGVACNNTTPPQHNQSKSKRKIVILYRSGIFLISSTFAETTCWILESSFAMLMKLW